MRLIYIYISYILIFFAAAPLSAEEPEARITGTMDWENLRIGAAITLDLSRSGISLPSGRPLAEALLFSRFSADIEPFILAIPLDSSSTLAGWAARGDISAAGVDALAAGASRLPPAYAAGFSAMSAAFTIDLAAVARSLARHSRPAPPPSTLTPVDAPEYTGILIIASEELPRHGLNAKAFLVPCLFPKVWDTDMNLIYEKSMVSPETFAERAMVRYTKTADIFQKTPSGIAPGLERVVGDKPLRVIARAAFGISATDPVIDRADALLIISNEANRRLLREGRVAVVLSGDALVKKLGG